MQKANRISAFFFLGLFGLIMLHQTFPHLHHQHEDSHSHSDIAHSGEHHHHEDGSEENEDSPFGFLTFFMDMHVHSAVSGDVVVLERNTIGHHTVFKKDIAVSAFETQKLFSLDIWQNESTPIYHPPNIYFNPYLSYPDLRGPPTLG